MTTTTNPGASGKTRPKVKFFSRNRLFPKQYEAFAGGGPNVRMRCCTASSGSGKTYGMGDIFGEVTQYCPVHTTTLWLAPSYTQARIGMDDMLSKMPEDVLRYMERVNAIGQSSGNMKINFGPIMAEFGYPHLGAQVNFRTAEKPALIMGGRNLAVAMDEASLCPVSAKNAALSTASKDGEENPIWAWGNVVDRYNWFYIFCRQIDYMNQNSPWEEQRFHHSELSYRDALASQQRDIDGNLLFRTDGQPLMVQTVAAIEDARFLMQDEPGRFEMLYENIPMGEAGKPFPDSLLDEMSTYCMHDETYVAPVTCVVCNGLSMSPPVAGAMDVAREIDMNCITAIDALGRICTFDAFYNSDWAETNDKLASYIPEKGNDLWWYDCTGVGDSAYAMLIDRHPRLKHKVQPFVKTNSNKSIMGQNLIRMGREGAILVPRGDMTDQLARIEAERTTTGMRYKAKEGFHDDIYDSLAMTVMLFFFGNHGNKGRVPKAFGDRQPLGVYGERSQNSFELNATFSNDPSFDRGRISR